ncbi:MAG: HAMP domain-containing sensor histidine kinase, partial [Myxococcota bacterium]
VLVSFVGFGLIVSALFTGLSFILLLTVEDTFIARSLEAQAKLSVSRFNRTGSFGETEDPMMRIHADLSTMPDDLRPQLEANPQQIEFRGEEGRHYHVMGLAGASPAWLVAEVSRVLVIRQMRGDILVLFGVASFLMTLLACALALRLAWRSIGPLRRLAAKVALTHPGDLPRDFGADFPANEIGVLAETLQGAFDRLRGFVERERAFTRDVSHDLRTPMAVVASSTELLRDCEDAAERARLVESVRVANTHMQRTVEALLALARETSPEGRGAKVPVAASVEQVVLQLSMSNPGRAVEVDVAIEPGATVELPPGVLEVVLANILGNAVQHAGHGRITVTLQGYKLQISDEGEFEQEVRSRALEPGVRGQGSAGLGRGLSIVRRVCERHDIGMEITHGEKGTAVSLSFEDDTEATSTASPPR